MTLVKRATHKAASRESFYTYLAGIFLQEPSVDLWPLQRQALAEYLKESGIEINFGETILEDAPSIVEKLRQEYYDCFFVPMSGKYVPPYESALLGYNAQKSKSFGPLNSNEANHVDQCYEVVGFNPRELNMFAPLKEIQFPDHAGFELIFMAMLCGAEKAAWERDNPSQAKEWASLQFQFLQEHLAKWWPNFVLALEKMAPGFYALAAKAGEIWIQSELDDFHNELNQGGISDARN